LNKFNPEPDFIYGAHPTLKTSVTKSLFKVKVFVMTKTSRFGKKLVTQIIYFCHTPHRVVYYKIRQNAGKIAQNSVKIGWGFASEIYNLTYFVKSDMETQFG